jgi:hypothetical protein
MNFKSLIGAAEVRAFTAADLNLTTLPAQGSGFLREAARRFHGGLAAFMQPHRFADKVELSSTSRASGPWYADRRIRFLVWTGDLVIDGDLIDDAFDQQPLLVIKGNLTVRHWLRGGMPGFVGGHVHASGFVIGHYNDSPLFVGGDLRAAGYIPRAKPYRDLPRMAPHQIAGRIEARRFDALDATDDALKAAFVDEVLEQDEEGCRLDESALLERARGGLPVWRMDCGNN